MSKINPIAKKLKREYNAYKSELNDLTTRININQICDDFYSDRINELNDCITFIEKSFNVNGISLKG